MNLRRILFGLIVCSCMANIGCVMFDGADDFPQPCYGADCQGGGLLQYGNEQYSHTGGYIGEPVFTPTAPVIPGGASLPPGVTEIQQEPVPTSVKQPETSVEIPMSPETVSPPVPATPVPSIPSANPGY